MMPKILFLKTTKKKIEKIREGFKVHKVKFSLVMEELFYHSHPLDIHRFIPTKYTEVHFYCKKPNTSPCVNVEWKSIRYGTTNDKACHKIILGKVVRKKGLSGGL